MQLSQQTGFLPWLLRTRNKLIIRICIDPRDLNEGLKRPHYPTQTVNTRMVL